jgi:DNA-binding transcriptional LysR family regulator
MVKSRHGFTILPELLVEALPMERLRAIPLRNFQREIGIAVRESRSTSPMAEAFLACVRTVLS